MVALWITILVFLLAVCVGLLFWQRTKIRRILDNLTFIMDCVENGTVDDIRYNEQMTKEEMRLGQYINAKFLAERELLAERMSMAPMLVEVQHKIQDTITALKVCNQNLDGHTRMNDSVFTICEQVQVETDKLHASMENLLEAANMSKSEVEANPEPVDVTKLLDAVEAQARPLAEEKGVTLEVAKLEIMVNMDLDLTTKAIMNIVENAIKYSPHEGKVTITAMSYETNCRIDVTDKGPGIPAEQQGYVYGRFWRAPDNEVKEGLGVGLFVSRALIQAQSGYIRLTSILGKGSTFSVFLPLAENEGSKKH